jgi:hypothetical protein
MIHNVKLSPIIERKLSEVVKVQMALLAYGASTNTPSQDDCACYLRNQGFDSSKPTRSAKIAEWVWRAQRCDPLIGFASGPSDGKHTLIERLQHDIDLLSSSQPVGTINTIDIPNKPRGKKTKLWQEHGADFLQRFYDDLNATTGLPAYLFSECVRVGSSSR